MKKVLSIIALAGILFSSAGNSVFAISKIDEKPTLYGNSQESEKGISQSQLTQLLAKKGFTKTGLNYLLAEKGVSASSLLALKGGSKQEKGLVLNRLVNGGLSGSQVFELKTSGGLTNSGLSIVGGPKPDLQISGDFLQPISDGAYKINFTDINSGNAGSVMQKWVGKNNLPNEFILEKGVKLKIDQAEYSKKLVKLSNVNKSKESLERQGIGVKYNEPELRLLPDRVQVIEQVELTYNSDSQLEKIKKDVYGGSDYELSNSAISLLGKNRNSDSGLSKNVPTYNKEEDLLKKSLLGDESKAPKSTIEYEKGVIEGLMEVCLAPETEDGEGFGKKASDCTEAKILAEIEAGEKVLTVEEKIEFSIIPPSSVGGDFNLLKMDPKDVRISRSQILRIFEDYGMMMEQISDPIEYPFEAQEARELDENPFTDEHCENRHPGNSQKITDCKNQIKKKNRTTREIYTKDLLNGFTLGESNSYTFSDRIRVGVRKWKKTIAEASITFYYSYGFGLRFPIQSKVIVEDSMMDDFGGNRKDYKVAVGLKTLDGTGSYYSGVGLPDEKVFEGKEFVMEFGAGFKVYLRAIGVGTIIDEDIELMSIIATLFRDKLINDLNIPAEEIDDIIRNNKFDKGRHFKPPFAGDNTVELFAVSTEIPLYTWEIIEVFIEIILESYLDGKIKVDCNDVNSLNGCDGTLEFNDSNTTSVSSLGNNTPGMKWKEFTSSAMYNDEGREEDVLGYYNNYGVILDNFRYIPEINIDAFLRGGARIYIPLYGWKTFRTDKYKIFSMELDIESDLWGTHDGTSGSVDATYKNKIYGTSPLVDVFPPVIAMVGNGTSEAEIRIRTNLGQSTYDIYTIHEEDRNMSVNEALTRNPYCRNAADGLPVNGDQWESDTIVWDSAITDLVTSKSFDLRARGCALNGKMSEVVTRTVDLENVAFDIKFRESNVNGEYRDYVQGNEITTDSDLELINKFYGNGMTLKYTVDGSIPNCSNNGEIYDGYFDLDNIGKTKLENTFNTTIKAIACNFNGDTLGEIFEKEYVVTNKAFDPVINMNPNANSFKLDAYNYLMGFQVYIPYGFVRDDPTCNDEHRIDIRTLGVQTNPTYEWIGHVPGATIKAKTCIRDFKGDLVFSSEVVSKATEAPHDNWDNRVGVNGNNPLNAIDEVMMEDIYGGFQGQLTNPGLMGGLNSLLANGSINMGAISGMNTLMMGGDMGGPGMGALGGMKNMSPNQMRGGFSSMMNSGKVSRKGLVGISSMLKTNKASLTGLIELAALYNKYNVTYSTEVKTDYGQKQEYKTNKQDYKAPETKKTPTNVVNSNSNDEYVNSKLQEINDCFYDSYVLQLESIDKAIKLFENNRDFSKDEKSKNKYQSAIDKMNEIRNLFLIRYENIINFENGIYVDVEKNESSIETKYMIQVPFSTYNKALKTKEDILYLLNLDKYSEPISINVSENNGIYYVEISEFDSERNSEGFTSTLYGIIHEFDEMMLLGVLNGYKIIEINN